MVINIFKQKLPTQTPEYFKKEFELLKACHTQEEALTKVYKIMTGRYKGRRIIVWLTLYKMLYPLKKVAKGGCYPCIVINYVTRLLLVKSGHFADNDITHKWSLVFFISPHQSLKVNLGSGKYTYLDIWSSSYGIKFGDYAKGFKSGSLNSKKSKIKQPSLVAH
jgi:hypothetical protein